MSQTAQISQTGQMSQTVWDKYPKLDKCPDKYLDKCPKVDKCPDKCSEKYPKLNKCPGQFGTNVIKGIEVGGFDQKS